MTDDTYSVGELGAEPDWVDEDPGKLYKIVRFFRDPDKDSYTVLDGLTLEEAQAHCSREDTHDTKEGWFDGYTEE